MPEFPDVELYLHALSSRILAQRLEGVRLASPFLLRSIDPPLEAVIGRTVRGLRRLGKRIVWDMGDEIFLVFHLMIAGRYQWKPRGSKVSGKIGLAAFDFASGTLLFTEAGSKRQASLYVVGGQEALDAHDPGGIDVPGSTRAAFAAALTRENHTLKRALTDPRILSGIGNAYSDEILHRARLSPLRRTPQLDDAELDRLLEATRATLTEWSRRLMEQTGDDFPEKVTAFHDEMAVHGRYRRPCPVCAAPVQRIVYSGRETNYCARCQTGGRLLADRALSRLLRDEWPRTLEEMEA